MVVKAIACLIKTHSNYQIKLQEIFESVAEQRFQKSLGLGLSVKRYS
jgi:hypothetical protein